MKYIKNILLLLLLFKQSYGQEKYKLLGHIQDNNKNTLIGVLVKSETTGHKTVSDANGHYEMMLPKGKHKLNFSYIGYEDFIKNITVNKEYHLDATMMEDAFGLDAVVVSSTKNHLNRKETVVSVGVLKAEMFEQTQSVSLLDGLKFQPGLRVDKSCQNCGSSEVSINGMSGEYSQVLIDGKPIFSGTNSIYGLEQIPSNMIERVEVIKGAGSAMYGANAIAGTINVITVEPTKNNFSLSNNYMVLGKGVYDNVTNVNANIVPENKRAALSIFANWRDRNAFDFNGDNFSDIPNLKNTIFGANRLYRFSEKTKVNIGFTHTISKTRGGDMLNINKKSHQSILSEEIETERFTFNSSIEGFLDNGTHYSSYANYQISDMPVYYGANGENGYGKLESKTYLVGTRFSNNLDSEKLGKNKINYGLEYKNDYSRDNKDGYNIDLKQYINTLGLYIQDDWKLNDRFTFLIGSRLEYFDVNYKDIGNRVSSKNSDFMITPRTNLMYNINKEYLFRLGYGRGFKYPQLSGNSAHTNISGEQIRQVTLGDNVKSETSDSYTLSFEFIPKTELWDFNFNLDAFYTRLSDPLIIEEKIDNNTSLRSMELTNGVGANVIGSNVELKMGYINIFQFQVNATYQNNIYDSEIKWSNNTAGTKKFLKTPNFYGNFILNYNQIKNIDLNLSGTYTGTQHIAHFAGGIGVDNKEITTDVLEKADDFFEFNIKINYNLNIKGGYVISYGLGVNNIFNSYQRDLDRGIGRDASYIYGPTSPRVYYLNLKFSLP